MKNQTTNQMYLDLIRQAKQEILHEEVHIQVLSFLPSHQKMQPKKGDPSR